MTSRDFCYWLQGYFEISRETALSPNATEVVRNHLNMVFRHEIDPSHGDASHQKALGQVHQGLGGGGTALGGISQIVGVDFLSSINC